MGATDLLDMLPRVATERLGDQRRPQWIEVVLSPVSVASRRHFSVRTAMCAPSALRTAHYRLLAVLWTVGLILAVTLPTGNVPRVQPAPGFDKIVHAVLFGGFGILWLRGLCPPIENGLSSRFPWRGFLLLSVGVLFAVGTEVYQHLAPIERMGSTYDVAADLFGLFVAFAGYYAHHDCSMNRTVLACGLVVILGMFLFPPYKTKRYNKAADMAGQDPLEVAVEYRPVWTKPEDTRLTVALGQQFGTDRLLLQVVMASVVFGAIAYVVPSSMPRKKDGPTRRK